MCTYLKANEATTNLVGDLQAFINDKEYDSDAIKYELTDDDGHDGDDSHDTNIGDIFVNNNVFSLNTYTPFAVVR